jgi:hypothetical protein
MGDLREWKYTNTQPAKVYSALQFAGARAIYSRARGRQPVETDKATVSEFRQEDSGSAPSFHSDRQSRLSSRATLDDEMDAAPSPWLKEFRLSSATRRQIAAAMRRAPGAKALALARSVPIPQTSISSARSRYSAFA